MSEGEIAAVRSLFLAYREGLFSKCQMPDEEWQSLPGVYAPPAGTLLLATIEGTPAGCVAMRPFPQADTAEMKRLYVLPECRRFGLGRQLVGALIEHARKRQYKRIRLDTHPPTMAKAISLYKELGFQEIPAAPLPPANDLLYMALDLTS